MDLIMKMAREKEDCEVRIESQAQIIDKLLMKIKALKDNSTGYTHRRGRSSKSQSNLKMRSSKSQTREKVNKELKDLQQVNSVLEKENAAKIAEIIKIKNEQAHLQKEIHELKTRQVERDVKIEDLELKVKQE